MYSIDIPEFNHDFDFTKELAPENLEVDLQKLYLSRHLFKSTVVDYTDAKLKYIRLIRISQCKLDKLKYDIGNLISSLESEQLALYSELQTKCNDVSGSMITKLKDEYDLLVGKVILPEMVYKTTCKYPNPVYVTSQNYGEAFDDSFSVAVDNVSVHLKQDTFYHEEVDLVGCGVDYVGVSFTTNVINTGLLETTSVNVDSVSVNFNSSLINVSPDIDEIGVNVSNIEVSFNQVTVNYQIEFDSAEPLVDSVSVNFFR